MKKSKKIILTLCTAFIAVLSLCFSFFNSNNTLQVKADSIGSYVSYSSSNLYIPVRRENYSSSNRFDCLLFAIDFSYDPSTDIFTYNVGRTSGFSPWQETATGGYVYNYRALTKFSTDLYHTTSINSLTLSNYLGSTFSGVFYYDTGATGSDTYLSKCNYKIVFSNSFNFNINSFDLGSNPVGSSHFSNYPENYLKYYDSNGNTMSIYFECVPVLSTMTISPLLSYRKYYINVDFSDSQIYNQGYNQGLLDNQTNIYDNGYNAGNTAGYSNGYNAGLNDSNEYSFFNLFGSVLDAPIQTLIGLFNFQLLGVNLWSLFTALLTLAVILFVLRLIRGGK